MRKLVLIGSAFALLGGCSMNANSSCFTVREGVVLPDKAKVLSNITNGQQGRDIAEAVMDGNAERVAQMLSADRRLATTQVKFESDDPTTRPQGQYGDLLTFAVARCDIEMIDTLLKGGVSPNGASPGGALTLALLADTPAMAELLLRQGASPDPQKLGGQDAGFEATAFGNEGAIMTLIRHKKDVNWADPMGKTLLHYAVDMERYRIAELLVEAGASLWAISGAGAMPVHNIDRAMIMERKSDEEARRRLLEKAKAAAPGWPPPGFADVRKQVLAGAWPTAEQKTLGMTVSAAALAYMRKEFGNEKP